MEIRALGPASWNQSAHAVVRGRIHGRVSTVRASSAQSVSAAAAHTVVAINSRGRTLHTSVQQQGVFPRGLR